MTDLIVPAVPRPSTGRRRGRRGLGTFAGILPFAAPGLILYALFVLIPVLATAGQSLTNARRFQSTTAWVGLANYADLLQDPDFWTLFRNTAIITLVVAIVPNVLGLLIALMVDGESRLYRALRAVYFVPVVLSGVVVSVIWQAILTDDGMLNSGLRTLGIAHPPGWLSDPAYAIWSVSTIVSWQVLGFAVVVYLAGLQAVPSELQDAAALDGAGPVQRFRAVTWPLLAPATTITTTMLLITGFKVYDAIQVLTNGGPGINGTATIAFGVVQTGIVGDRIAAASTLAIVMLIIAAVLSLVSMGILRRRELDL